MRKIVIKPGNALRIEEALKQVNGRARAHAITTARAVEALAHEVEQAFIERGATKKSLLGTQVQYRPGGPGNSYAKAGLQVITTSLTLERGSTHWALVGIERETIWASDKKKSHVALSEAAIRKIAKAALGDLNIVGAPSCRFEPLLQRALTVACMPCRSSHEKLAILKVLETELPI
ncbi:MULTISPECIES: hypothetical protein [unclassified Sulfitobacter]|uniref:hypothetical protein n=1 Tax=unclassified Sulfitobacter TaxID=196795 RepID=UPI003745E933